MSDSLQIHELQASLSFTISWSLLKLMSTELVMTSNYLILYRLLIFLPSSGSFPMNQLFTSGGQSTGASASASVLPVNIQGWFPLGLTGLSPCCPRDSQESLLQHHSSKASLALSLLYGSTLTSIHDYWEKIKALTIWTFVSKVMSLLFKVMSLFFNTLSRFVIAFLPRNKHLLVSWLQSPSTVILDYFTYLLKNLLKSMSERNCFRSANYLFSALVNLKIRRLYKFIFSIRIYVP